MPSATAIQAADWHGHTPDEWARRWGAPRVVIFRRTGSTNDEARTLAGEGAPAGTVVIADEQTSGRGQHGRSWRAAPGHGLLLSIVLDPSDGEEAADAAVLPLRIGIAAARALEAVTGLDSRIKWPNDLVVRERKLAGILCETARQGERTLHLVAGIGINLRQSRDDWPPDLAGRATSVEAETGRPVDAAELAGRIVHHVRSTVQDARRVDRAGLTGPELHEIRRRDALLGRPVTVDGRAAGTAHGVTHQGALIIVDDDGTTREVRAGTVRVADPRSLS